MRSNERTRYGLAETEIPTFYHGDARAFVLSLLRIFDFTRIAWHW